MSELFAVTREAARLREAGTSFLLATVVRVSGSSYRRAGARMIVAEDRRLAGCVSGGCLEGDVLMRGLHRTRTGPVVVTYDSTGDDDVAWGFGLGCNGVVEVLLERVDPSTRLDSMRFVAECLESEQPGVLATILRGAVGERFARRGDHVKTTIGDAALREWLDAETRSMPARPRIAAHGAVEALVEPILPPPHVFVIGSNHDATSVVAAANALGWRTTVVDSHARFASRTFGADRMLVATPAELAAAIAVSYRAYAVLMTHDYDRDRAFLAALLSSRARYVGVLGPERRTSRMLAEIARTEPLSDSSLARLHAPVGLDVGAETPAEIALAIVSEIQATLTSSPAGRLRGRSGGIHAAEPEGGKHVAKVFAEPGTAANSSPTCLPESDVEANSSATCLPESEVPANSSATCLPESDVEANSLATCLPESEVPANSSATCFRPPRER